MVGKWRTPPNLAKQFGVAPRKVLGLIKSGELVAVNMASTTAKRPLWRISPEAVDAFIAKRQSRPPVQETKRRRVPVVTKTYV